MKKISLICGAIFALSLWLSPAVSRAQEADVRNIVFPVFGSASYSNDWQAQRIGHLHQGNDIFGTKHQPLIAAVDGTVKFVPYPEPSYGWMVSIEDSDGYEYWYLHINNDDPGTDDGIAPAQFAYAFGMRSGWPVKAGQLIGYMGDSGNAESTRSHLHFEIHRPDGNAINPYLSLQAAYHAPNITPTPLREGEIQPFANFKGGARIATGNVDPSVPGDEIVVAAGPGGGPHVRVYAADGYFLSGFFVPDVDFRTGLDVSVGDINNDGTDEIIVGLGPQNLPAVYVFRVDGLLLSKFNAYDPRARVGVNVAAADLDGDGSDEIIVGPMRFGGPDVRVYRYTGELLRSFYAYDPRFHGGVDVAGVDADVFGSGRIVTGAGPGGGPDVRVFDYNSMQLVFNYFAFYREFRGGVHVTVWPDPSDTNQPVILTTPVEGLQSFVHRHTFYGALLEERLALENWWLGGFDIAAANGYSYIVTGQGRPVSIQSTSYADSWH